MHGHEAQLAQKDRVVEEVGGEQRVVLRQAGNVGGVDGIAVVPRMAGAAGAAVAAEGLREEDSAALLDQVPVRGDGRSIRKR
jgi:hypothetical protein